MCFSCVFFSFSLFLFCFLFLFVSNSIYQMCIRMCQRHIKRTFFRLLDFVHAVPNAIASVTLLLVLLCICSSTRLGICFMLLPMYILPCCVYLCATRHHRRLADEDDELSEVQPDAVPPEVREWLASTFTRQLVTTRKRTEEKPKFRTVAHAIRAGIFVDRIYRRVSSTAMLQFPPEVVKVLKVKMSQY